MTSSIVVENLHVTVPYVREIAPGDAAKLLENAGLVPEITGSTCSKVGAWVFSQSPRAAMKVLPSSIVRMSCRTGPIP
ncbi:MAG: PASTA domain-containing protein [Candidatus Competibacter phosphatis]